MGQDLAHKRPWLMASLVVAISYIFHHSLPLGDEWIMLWKASACGFLALYALHHHNKGPYLHFAIIMLFSALADALVNYDLIWGGSVFAIAHIVAINFYAKHRRPSPTVSQRGLGFILPVANPLLAFAATHDPMTAAYALVSGIMAGMAWTSSFPRYRTGIGALLFLLSDLMIFTGIGSTAESILPQMTIWVVYYFGQLLIAVGVVQTLVKQNHYSLGASSED